MIYYGMTIKEGIITGVHESGLPFTSDTFKHSIEYASDEVHPLEDKKEYKAG